MDEFKRQLLALLPRLRRFALTVSQAEHEADDLVQAAVERALRHAAQWTPGSALDSWMYRIIQNLWRDELRAHRRRAESLDDTDELVGEDGRDSHVQSLQWQELRLAMRSLPEEQRVVLNLVVLDGMSYQQAAEFLEVPIGTVMSRLARARARLAERLDGATHSGGNASSRA
ncbi:RNA polymerase sigma-70 factor, ECF subfamily [Solimonas aquatica]|uniref:RNA polymerase sigma-70 factor, ECF subfamily n=1 Tax=Solimonas aquatica TaxID=489703 RepID=A0A1H9ALS1_9GAMM|nr:RNA polymerase sigma factor [Solimonas aquatica]SEP77704.1 RNA polymerase sigma-70 factor, ECF subfamily [Solimonas aquatica]